MDQTLKQLLRQHGWIKSDKAIVTPLTGGVSSDIYLVEDSGQRFVVKRALEKLKVESDWFADTRRNHCEQAFIRYVGTFRPDAMPEILGNDTDAGFFIMEYLEGLDNWKQTLLDGQCDPAIAQKAGKLMGEIHARSWNDPDVMSEFDSMPNFDQLRIDPYIRATALKHPQCASSLLAEAERLISSRQCLIHGDYSPKNILFNSKRLVPLDCEVACFADAAFDLGFFLNHLYLKSLYHRLKSLDFESLINAVRTGYRAGNPRHSDEVEVRVTTLLPMLMLARVDGKSPVEYLNHNQQNFIREFSTKQLGMNSDYLDAFQQRWFKSLYN